MTFWAAVWNTCFGSVRRGVVTCVIIALLWLSGALAAAVASFMSMVIAPIAVILVGAVLFRTIFGGHGGGQKGGRH